MKKIPKIARAALLPLLFCLAQTGWAQTEDELWRKFSLDPTEENVQQFLAYYPTSPLLPQMAERIWGLCKADLDKKSCDLYVRYFPAGEHAAEAGQIRQQSQTSDVETIVDGVVNVADDIVQILTDDDNDPDEDNGETSNDALGNGTVESIPPPPAVTPSPPPPPVQSHIRPSGGKKPTATATASRPSVPPKPPTHPVATPPKPKSAQLYGVSTQHNYVFGQQKGMLFHLNFTLEGLGGDRCAAVVYFLDENGQPILDLNGQYKSKKGKAASVRHLRPPGDGAVRYGDFKLFMPYAELHRKGKHPILYYAALRAGGKTLAKSQVKRFTLTWH